MQQRVYFCAAQPIILNIYQRQSARHTERQAGLPQYLTKDAVTASGSVCSVNEDDCVSCGACISVCSYGAIEFAQTPAGKKARVNPVLCKGDGLCNSGCPTGAIFLKHFTDDEISTQIDALFSNDQKKAHFGKVVGA